MDKAEQSHADIHGIVSSITFLLLWRFRVTCTISLPAVGAAAAGQQQQLACQTHRNLRCRQLAQSLADHLCSFSSTNTFTFQRPRQHLVNLIVACCLCCSCRPTAAASLPDTPHHHAAYELLISSALSNLSLELTTTTASSSSSCSSNSHEAPHKVSSATPPASSSAAGWNHHQQQQHADHDPEMQQQLQAWVQFKHDTGATIATAITNPAGSSSSNNADSTPAAALLAVMRQLLVSGSSSVGIASNTQPHRAQSQQQQQQQAEPLQLPTQVAALLATDICTSIVATSHFPAPSTSSTIPTTTTTSSSSSNEAGPATRCADVPSAWQPLQQCLASMAAAALHDLEQTGSR
jgi:hypothetical protein